MDAEVDTGYLDAETVRACYAGAAQAFRELTGQIQEHDWSRPALGDWDVRALAGHTSRALTTVEAYLATPATGDRVAGPVEYFLTVRGAMSPGAIAQRGTEAGNALGEDPAAAVRELVQRVTSLVRDTPDDALVATPAGTMTLIDYLPTRIFELAVHTLDLARALEVPPPASLAPAVAASLELAGAIGSRLPSAGELLLLLTGRTGLPGNLSVI